MRVFNNKRLKNTALFALGAWLPALIFAAAAETSATRTIQWSDLVPDDWEAPLILPAPEADGHYPVDPASLVQKLDKQAIGLAGFMVPVRYEQNVVSEFLFLPYLPHHITSHAHYHANQMVYVKLAEPITVDNPFSPWFVQGLLHVASVTTEDGRTGYTMEQARAESYNADIHETNVPGHSNN